MPNRLTRRRFLLGAAVAAGGVAAGVRLLDGDGIGSAGPSDGPTYRSVGRARVGAWFPPGDITAVLVCLHGRGADERFAFEGIGLHRFAAAAAFPFAVVSVDGGAASYWHPRRDGTDAGRLVTDEVVPWALERAPGAVPVLVGWSMGGYGALLLASADPGRFPVAVATAPALWQRAADTPAGAFDDAEDFAAHDVFPRVDALRRVRVRLDCGADDPFAAATRALSAQLPEAEGGIRPGRHDSASWRRYVPDQLAFVERSVSAVAPRRPGG